MLTLILALPENVESGLGLGMSCNSTMHTGWEFASIPVCYGTHVPDVKEPREVSTLHSLCDEQHLAGLKNWGSGWMIAMVRFGKCLSRMAVRQLA